MLYRKTLSIKNKSNQYKRYKFGDWMEARINHFQDDDGNDVFVPIRKV